ncbi:MAG: hypothetical protein ABL962_14115 [Fimbriimonadaceae bacterium]
MSTPVRIFFMMLLGAGSIFLGRIVMAAITHLLGQGRVPVLEWLSGAMLATFWLVLAVRTLRQRPEVTDPPKPLSPAWHAAFFFPLAFLMQVGNEVFAERPVDYGKELFGACLMTATFVGLTWFYQRNFTWFYQRKASPPPPPFVTSEAPKFDI